MTVKVKAKQLTYEDFGNRIIHTNEVGTTTSRIIAGVETRLKEAYIKTHVPTGVKPHITAHYLITIVTFLDQTKLTLAGDSLVELDADTTPMEFRVLKPNQTGLR